MKNTITYLLLLVFLSSPVWAADVYVGTGGSNTSPYETVEKAATSFSTLNGYDPGSGDHTIHLITGAVPTDETITLSSWSLSADDTVTIQGTTENATIDTATLGDEAILVTHAGVNWVLQNFKVDGGTTGAVYQIYLQDTGSVTVDNVDWDHATTSADAMHGLYIQDFTDAISITNSTGTCYYEAAEDGSDSHCLAVRQGNGANDPNQHGSAQITIANNTLSNGHADLIMFYNIESSTRANIYNNVFDGYGENAIDVKASRGLNIYNNRFKASGTVRKTGAGARGSINLNNSGSPDPDDQESGDVSIYGNTFVENYDDSAVYYAHIVINPGSGGDNFDIYGNYLQDAYPAISVIAGDEIHIRSNIFHAETNPADTNFSRDECLLQVFGDPTNLDILNNTFYQDTDVTLNDIRGIYILSVCDTQSQILIRNNIIFMTDTDSLCLDIETGTGTPDTDYNTYWNDSNVNILDIHGTTYARDTGSPYTNDAERDPVFTDAANGDLSLIVASSSDDDAGETLGAAFDEGINPNNDDFTATPPESTLIDRDAPWDRGAYEYVESANITGISIN